jgi:chitodextrinase
MTLEAWVFPTSAALGWHAILQKEVDAYFLHSSGAGAALDPTAGGTFSGAVSYFPAQHPMTLNTWNHVAVTWDGATMRFYINGVAADAMARGGTLQSTTTPLRIGGNLPYGEFFQGRIDEVRIYSRALTPTEVQSDMNTPVGPAGPDATPPSNPSGLAATAAGSSQVDLTWTAATDNVGVAGYMIERCQNAGCSIYTQIATPSSTSYSDTGLASSTSYSYRVRARDGAGNTSGYSNIATATTAVSDPTPPTTPSALVANAINATQVNLSWTASTDNIGVSGYRVERCQGAGCSTFTQVATPSSPSYSDTNLNASTSYSYRVRAVDAAGNVSPFSNVASATTAASSLGAVAAYGFDEGTGLTAADATGNGNAGALTNGPTWTAGKYGGALSFDGNNDFVLVNSSASLTLTNAMTLEAWVFPTSSAGGWHAIMQKEVDAYFLHSGGGGPPLDPTAGGTFSGQLSYFAASSLMTLNSWNHVAFTWDGSIMRLYVNGVAAATQNRGGTLQSTTTPLRIGGNSPYGEMFQGRIDEVRIYNRALTQTEVLSDMNSPITPTGPDTTSPTIPTGLAATAASATQVNLTWTASTDNLAVAGYLVERCQNAGCSSFSQIATPTGTSYSDTTVLASTSYSYRVRAIDAAGNTSGYSTTAGVTTPILDVTPPSAPSGLNATATSTTQINLAWSASTDNVGVTSYRIERCQGTGCSNFSLLTTVSVTSFSNTGLTASTSYSYRVRANDAAGNASAFSNVASATTQTAPDTTVPSTPTGLTATAASSSQINLSWTASTDNVGVTGYQVFRCLGASCTNFTLLNTAPSTTYTDTGLTASTAYRYRLRAADAAGNLSANSAIATATTLAGPPDTTLPTAPASLTATATSSSQINLSWPAATDNVGVTGYRVERCLGSGCSSFSQVATPTTTTYSDSGLVASTSYSYRVRAADAAGNLGPYSPLASATTQAASLGPAIAYAFNEGTGTTTADASGNGVAGTLTNGPTWIAGKYGTAVSFDGNDDKVALPSSVDVAALPFTLEAWIRPTNFNPWHAIFSKRTSYSAAGMRFDVGLATGSGQVYVTTFSSTVTFNYAPPLNAWTHIAVVATASGTSLYVNGALQQSSGALTLGTGATAAVNIGRTGDNDDPFAGGIDDLRLYKRALTLVEIQNDMNTPVTP